MKKRNVFYNRCLCLFLIGFILAATLGCGSAKKAEISPDNFWGRSDAKEIDINTKVAGRITRLLVKEGDVVKKGQIIAYVDKRTLDTQSAQAKANISSLQAQSQEASLQTTLQYGTTHSDIDAAQAQVNQAEDNLSLAQADFERYQSLVQIGGISAQTFDSYRTKYLTAQQTYNQSKANLQKATDSLMQNDVNQANESVIQEKIEQAQAGLQEIEVSIDETEIKAPFDGIITKKYVEEGSMLSLGTPIVAVQDPTDNWVDFKVPETLLPNYKLQQHVVLIHRDGKTKVEGTIVDISKKSEFATERATSERNDDSDIISFNMKVQVNSDILRPGMRFKLLQGAYDDTNKENHPSRNT